MTGDYRQVEFACVEPACPHSRGRCAELRGYLHGPYGELHLVLRRDDGRWELSWTAHGLAGLAPELAPAPLDAARKVALALRTQLHRLPPGLTSALRTPEED